MDRTKGLVFGRSLSGSVALIDVLPVFGYGDRCVCSLFVEYCPKRSINLGRMDGWITTN